MKRAKAPSQTLVIPVVRARVLGVNVYRGFARLCDLADISRADIYDQKTNPKGTQRDLSPQHAKDAYQYIRSKSFGFWPEVFLSSRSKRVSTFAPSSAELPDLGLLSIDQATVSSKKTIAIARVDGNHRLHYADGKVAGFARVEKVVSFCLAYDLSREEEIQLFKDINKNQKPMNTSHLDGIEVRLSAADELKKRTPELYIARRLHEDQKSPLFNRVYDGGKKSASLDVPLRGLKTGIEYLLSRSTQLPQLPDAEAQYRVVRNFFAAVKKWQPMAWAAPKDYLLLRGSGLWAICFIGAQVIDRALLNAKFDVADMHAILESGAKWDWGRNGDFRSLGGRAGALEIATRVSRKLKDDSRMSTSQLFDKIMSGD